MKHGKPAPGTAGSTTDDHGRQQARQISRRASSIILALTLLGAAAIRLVRMQGNSLWYDELYTVWASRLPLERLFVEVPASGHPPLYYLIGHFWFAPGSGELRLRMISLVAGLVTVGIAYLLGKELFSRRAGLLAAALTAVSPPMVRYSSEVTDWALMIAATTAALYFLVLGVKRGRTVYWAAFVAAVLVAAFSNLFAGPFVVALAAFYLLYDRKPRRRLKSWLASQAVLVPAMAVWALLNRSAEEEVFGRESSWFSDIILGIGRAPLLIISDSNHVDVSSLWGAFLMLLLAAMTAALVSRGGRKALTEGSRLGLLAVVGITLVADTIIVLITQQISVDELSTRYFMVATVPILLLVAGAVDAINMKYLAYAAAGMLVAVSLWSLQPTVRTAVWDYRGVAAVVDEGFREGDIMLGFPTHHYRVALANYSSRDIDVAGGWIIYQAIDNVMFPGSPGTRWEGYKDSRLEGEQLSGEELRRQLEAETAGAKRVWIAAGDDEVYKFASSEGVEAALGDEWIEVGRWDFEGPLVLKLLERNAGG